MFSIFRLHKSVGVGYLMAADDEVSVRDALRRLDLYRQPKVPYDRNPLIQGLKDFQKFHRLYVDGIVRRGGPTEKWINVALWEVEQTILHARSARPCAGDPYSAPYSALYSDDFCHLCLLSLSASVGRNGINRGRDLRLAEHALALAGYYPAARVVVGSVIDEQANVEMAVMRLQRDFHRTCDGLMKSPRSDAGSSGTRSGPRSEAGSEPRSLGPRSSGPRSGRVVDILSRLIAPVLAGDIRFGTMDGRDVHIPEIVRRMRMEVEVGGTNRATSHGFDHILTSVTGGA